MISLLLVFARYLPWVFIALVGALALRRRTDSKALLFQALGASACFVFGIARWVVAWVLSLTSASGNVYTAIYTIFDFLLFVALAVFALGYCMEKLRRPSAAVAVTATPVER